MKKSKAIKRVLDKNKMLHGFPLVKEIPQEYKGTSRIIQKGKNKGYYQLFDR